MDFLNVVLTETGEVVTSIDTPAFWALLNERDEGAMDPDDAKVLEGAIVAHIHAWHAALVAKVSP